MNHAYLSETAVLDALLGNAITKQEAEKLKKKISCQETIFKAVNK